jgi:hypothetical protein
VGLVCDPRGLLGVTTARPRVAGVLQGRGGVEHDTSPCSFESVGFVEIHHLVIG